MTASQKTDPANEQPSQPLQSDQAKPGNMLINLAFNIIIPTLIMTKLSGEDYLGPMLSIVVALAFPVGYGARDYLQSRKANLFSVLGIFSVVMTGGMSLLHIDPQYIAIKEAAVPACFGIATLLSIRTRYPLVKTFLFNEQILQISKVTAALTARNNLQAFEAKLTNASFMVAGSFFLSSVLNYILAKVILVSQPGTVEFTEQLGKMTALSFPVIALPSTLVLMGVLFYLLHHIRKMTHLETDDIFKEV